MQELITRTTLQTQLDISKSTIIRWERLGLPVIRIGGLVRYDLAKVMNWISLNEVVKGITK
jgi:phage terminase Nu1 subunit (DNA packaging protein)